MRHPVLVAAAVALSVVAVHAAQSRDTVTGRVVDRDGAGVPRCVVEFQLPKAERPEYRAYTDAQGNFSLKEPQPGDYEVTITQRERKHTLRGTVRITSRGLDPAVLSVPW